MSLETKLKHWRDAGLIDAQTHANIIEYERSHERPVVLYALGGLGALTVGIGIISIVAANWDAIGREVKLGADLLIGIALIAGIYTSVQRERMWVTEVLAGIYWVYVLASLALIGQVYQLGSPTHHALLAWSLSTAPLMLLVRTRLLGLAWLGGLIWTHADTAIFYLEQLHRSSGHDDTLLANVACVVVVVSAFAYWALSRVPWFVRERPQVSTVWMETAWAAIVGGSLVLCFVFYESLQANDTVTWALPVCAVILGLWIALLPRLQSDLNPRALLGMRVLLGAAGLVLVLATSFERPSMEAVGAVLQVLLLGLCAWTVLQLGSIRMFNSLTGLIALRVLVMYFEVFGSMLDTGVGMISGGVLTLVLAWLWKRKSPDLAAHLTRREDTHAA